MHPIAKTAPEVCAAGSSGEVIAVDVAAAKAVAAARPVAETETLPLRLANGRILAADLLAGMDLPPFDTSAMDGFAVRLASFAGPGPWRLSVGARVAAGDPGLGFGTAEAVRIFTGAVVPRGFDAVVMQEHCQVEGDAILIAERPRLGRNIRRAGEDIRSGQHLLRGGTCLSPQRLALLAAEGLAEVDVVRKVRVGLISTGSELRDPGSALAPGQIYNSNRVMLHAALDELGWAEVIDFGIVPDRRDLIGRALAEARLRCDAIIATGGVSAGEEDHVFAAFSAEGGMLDILKVAMRPGKPVKVGRLADALFFGLPGNPNAALITFCQIALPSLRALAGLRAAGQGRQAALSSFEYAKTVGRTEFVPVRVIGRSESGLPLLEMLGRGSSASLRSIADADGIATLPPDTDAIAKGQVLRYEPFG